MRRPPPGLYRAVAHALGFAPLAWLGARYLRDDLPVLLNRYLMLRSGVVALALLVAALACTPARILFGWRWAALVRRTLGLYAVAYSVAHLVVYAQFENGLDWRLIWRDLGERRSMAIGLASLLVLTPLALTSTAWWQRKLGPRWRTLHRLVYLAVPLAVAHYYYLDRDDRSPPLFYAAFVAVLLVVRLPPLRRAIARLRRA
jgi:sulfoxide reductase heme-binding subunit YedZ